VFLLIDYNGNINANSLKLAGTPMHVKMMNPLNCYSTPPNQPLTNYWYFSLTPGQTAEFVNGYATSPMRFALWVPVDSSSTGQEPSTCWFSNWCFGPTTYRAPTNAVPAGATFVEVNLNNSVFDTVNISEVNGVTALWKVELPGRWTNKSFSDPQGNLIPVGHIANNPGSGPTFFGDYGNPGVYPFGCTDCASRLYNQIPKAGCLKTDSMAPIDYPANDVGCNNAIDYYSTNNNDPVPGSLNAPNRAYENPPGGTSKLPADKYAPDGELYNLTKNPPATIAQQLVGYGICEVQRGNAPQNGDIKVTLRAYPFGEIQPQP